MRVVVVDDHPLVRGGLVGLLEREHDVEVVGQAETAEAGLALIEAAQPDIAIVDHSMPGMSGVDMCRIVTQRHPRVGVILLTSFLTDEVVQGALEAGASAYVAKDGDAQDVVRAIRSVNEGGGYLDARLVGRVASWAGNRRRSTVEAPLTVREIDVLRLVRDGRTNREIATALCMSENTVRTYVKRIFTKLGSHR
jgi:DNA-binding NarL/FixJ family response regulator